MRGDDAPIAVDLGTRGVKVAQAVLRAGRVVGVRVGFDQLADQANLTPEEQSSQVEQALRRALDQSGARGRRAVVVLSRQQVTLRFTELPSARSEEMAKMAALEAEQHIPLPAAEMVLGHEVVGPSSPTSGLTPVVIAAARKSVVQEQLARFAAVDLYPVQVTVDALCLFHLWQGAEFNTAPAFVVEMGARGILINLVEGGLLRMSRAAPGGGEELTRAFQADFGLSFEEAEERKRESGLIGIADAGRGAVAAWVEQLVTELRRTAMSFAGQNSRPTTIYLTGGGSLLMGLDQALESALGVRVARLGPGANLLSPAQSSLFAVPFAASQAHSAKPEVLNLLLPEAVAEKRTLQRRRSLTTAGVAGAITLLALIGGSYFALLHREAEIKRLTPEWREAKRTLVEARTLTEQRDQLLLQADYLAGANRDQHYFLDLLLEIHQRAPKGVWLTSLMLERASGTAGKSGTLQITGKAPDNKVVADLVSALSPIPALKQVNLQSAKASTFGEKQVVEFSLSGDLATAPASETALNAAGEKEGKP